jgi:hypothetical protein
VLQHDVHRAQEDIAGGIGQSRQPQVQVARRDFENQRELLLAARQIGGPP